MKKQQNRFENIICTIPEYCDDCESWHILHLWGYYSSKRTTYTTCDSDGNHEPCTSKEAKQIADSESTAWIEYSKWVINHNGDDPCFEFSVPRKKEIKRKVVATFGTWIGTSTHGLSLDKTIIGKGVETDWRKLPVGVLQFLELEKVGDRQVAPWAKSVQEAQEYLKKSDCIGCFGKIGAGFYIKFTAEWDEPIPERIIRKQILAAAKRSVARREKAKKLRKS